MSTSCAVNTTITLLLLTSLSGEVMWASLAQEYPGSFSKPAHQASRSLKDHIILFKSLHWYAACTYRRVNILSLILFLLLAQTHLQRKGVGLGSWFQGPAHRGGEALVAGAGKAGWSLCILCQEKEGGEWMNACAYHALLFLRILESHPWNGATHH